MIYNSENIYLLKELPVLDKYQYYIYIILNYPSLNIKIGQTTNILQRLKSLSGSNGGGNKIIKLWVSDPTYVKTMESSIHDHYNKYRINGTEWFKDLDFNEVVKHVDYLFNTNGYKKCNEIRKEIAEKEIQKENKIKDKNEEESVSSKRKTNKNKKVKNDN